MGWPSSVKHPIPISDGITEARSLPQIPGVLCMKRPPQLSLDQGLEEIARVISPFKRVHPHLSKLFPR